MQPVHGEAELKRYRHLVAYLVVSLARVFVIDAQIERVYGNTCDAAHKIRAAVYRPDKSSVTQAFLQLIPDLHVTSKMGGVPGTCLIE
jgi:hypothetical protein